MRKGSKHAVNIAFFDVSKMNALTQVFFLLGTIGIFASLIWFFYNRLVVGPEAERAAKEKERADRRSKKV